MLSPQILLYVRWAIRGVSWFVSLAIAARLVVSYGPSVPSWYFSGFAGVSSLEQAGPDLETRLFLMPTLQVIGILLLLIHWVLWEQLLGTWLSAAPAHAPSKPQKPAPPASSGWDP